MGPQQPATPLAVRWRPALIDFLIALALFTLAAVGGAKYFKVFHATGARASFGQGELAASVALACGKGFVNPGYALSPALTAFLTEQREDVNCSEFPAVVQPNPLNFTQGLYRYLHIAIGVTWWWTGVSWAGLAPLAGVFFGASAALAYAVFRLGMGRILALAGAVLMGCSAIQLGNLPYLRDYAKAPFMLALLFLLGLLVKRPLPRSQYVMLAAAFGGVLGIGFGFRNDMLITLLPFLLAVWVLPPVSIIRNWRTALLATGAMAVVFAIVASPILSAYSSGSNSGHVAVLGLMSTFDPSIGIARSVYEWGHTYLDGYAASVITSYALRGGAASLEYLSPAYDQAAARFLADVAWRFPADMLARGAASVVRVLDLPFSFGAYTNPTPYGITMPSLVDAYKSLGSTLAMVNDTGTGVVLAVASVTVISVASVRLAAFATLLVLYFGAYPVIQFAGRHLFYLEFVTIWSAGIILTGVAWVVRQAFRSVWYADLRARFFGRDSLRRLARATILLIAVPAVLTLTVTATAATARAYQRPHVEAMLDQVLQSPVEKLDVKAVPAGPTGVRHELTAFTSYAAPGKIETDFLMAEFGGGECDSLSVPVTLRYQFESVANDYSEPLEIPLPHEGEITRVIFPTYRTQWTRFVGIEMPAASGSCFDRISRVAQPERFPILVTAVLPSDWKSRRLYHALTRWEGSEAPLLGYPPMVSVPAGINLPRRAINREGTPSPPPNFLAPISSASGPGAWSIDGTPSSQNTYLLSFPPTPHPAGALLVVHGVVRRGGLSIGIIRNDTAQWAGVTSTQGPGPFILVVQAPVELDYVPVIADYRPGSPREPDGSAYRVEATIDSVTWWSAPRSQSSLTMIK